VNECLVGRENKVKLVDEETNRVARACEAHEIKILILGFAPRGYPSIPVN
jgi:hypothetical protein